MDDNVKPLDIGQLRNRMTQVRAVEYKKLTNALIQDINDKMNESADKGLNFCHYKFSIEKTNIINSIVKVFLYYDYKVELSLNDKSIVISW